MTAQKKFTWFYVVGFLWGLIGILCVLPAFFFVAFMDESTGSKFADNLFIFGALSFPVISFIIGIIIILLGRKHKKLALFASFTPILPLLPIFLVWTLESVGLGNFVVCGASECKQSSVEIPISTCNGALPDFNDSLTTTGCGQLALGLVGAGNLNAITEAQDWEFSGMDPNRELQITLKSDGTSCPQVRVFDTNGKLLNGFPLQNKPVPCMQGGNNTSFYKFTPPENGIFILRITTPITPGKYWIMIN